MSLISTRNLLAPLQNKVHFVTIVLIAVAFLVLRLSGGSVSVNDRSKPVPNRESPHKEQEQSNQPAEEDLKMFDPRKEAARLGLAPAPGNRSSDQKAGERSSNDSLLGTIMRNRDKKRDSGPALRREEAAPSRKSGNSLDDIEQSLGLR